MTKGFELKGLKEVIDNLHREVEKIDGRSLQGLIRGAMVIHRAVEPKVPVDTGNLRASWFYVTSKGDVRIQGGFDGEHASQAAADTKMATSKAAGLAAQKGAKGAFVIVGFGANYAILVHEDIPTARSFQRPGAESKFLEKAIKENQTEILQKIADSVKF